MNYTFSVPDNKRVRMIVSTDCKNEADDQFALAHHLMTPMFIKEPFMNMVYQWPNAFYVSLNPQHAIIPKEIKKKSLAISDDIAITLKQLLGESTIGMKGFDAKEAFNPSRVY